MQIHFIGFYWLLSTGQLRALGTRRCAWRQSHWPNRAPEDTVGLKYGMRLKFVLAPNSERRKAMKEEDGSSAGTTILASFYDQLGINLSTPSFVLESSEELFWCVLSNEFIPRLLWLYWCDNLSIFLRQQV